MPTSAVVRFLVVSEGSAPFYTGQTEDVSTVTEHEGKKTRVPRLYLQLECEGERHLAGIASPTKRP